MLISHCKAKLQNYTAWEKKTFPGLLSFRVTIIQLTLLHNSSDFYFNHIWIQFRLGKIAFFLTKVVVNIKLFSSVFIFADRAEYFNLIDHFWTFYLYIHSKDMLLQNMTKLNMRYCSCQWEMWLERRHTLELKKWVNTQTITGLSIRTWNILAI